MFTKIIESIRTAVIWTILVTILETPNMLRLTVNAFIVPMASAKIKNSNDTQRIGTVKMLSNIKR